MKKEELQRIITDLQEIKNAFETGEFNIQNLMRLASCMGDLRKYPKYFERTEGILNMIKEYMVYAEDDFVYAIEKTIENLTAYVESIEEGTIFGTIKRGYKDVKNIISEAIPEEAKNKCGEAINTASIIGATVKQEMPKCIEKVEQIKGTPKKFERKVKSALRNWLMSEDSEEN